MPLASRLPWVTTAPRSSAACSETCCKLETGQAMHAREPSSAHAHVHGQAVHAANNAHAHALTSCYDSRFQLSIQGVLETDRLRLARLHLRTWECRRNSQTATGAVASQDLGVVPTPRLSMLPHQQGLCEARLDIRELRLRLFGRSRLITITTRTKSSGKF